MGKAWIYMCIPPVLGLLVFAAAKSAGSVEVPTQAQIDAAPSKHGGRVGGGGFDPERLAEALREAGIGQGGSSGSAGTPTVRPKTTPSPSTKPKGPFREDLIERYEKGIAGNIHAHKSGIIAGIVAAVVGYALVAMIIYRNYKRRATWKDALAAGQNSSSAWESEEG